MTLRNPAVYEEALTYHARDDRQSIKALARGSGVVKAGDCAVAQNGTPNMSVNIAAGEALVNGTEATDQGAYYLFNDAVVNLAVAAADPTNPRNDLVILTVRDDFYSTHGGSPATANTAAIQVITGTPAGSPVDPAVPANSVTLARIRVDALVTTIVNAKITDLRPLLGMTLVGALAAASGAITGNLAVGTLNGANPPLGTVAYAQVLADQAAITVITDLTGLTVTFTAVASRRYRVTAKIEVTASVADGAYVVTLADGANTALQRATDACLTTSARSVNLAYVEVPGAGTITRKLRLSKAGGTGTLTGPYGGGPAFILVEDIGT